MLFAKKLFSFHYCYTGRKNLTIQPITKEVKYNDKKIYILFPLKEYRVKQPIPKTSKPQNSCSGQDMAHKIFTSFLLP